MSLWSIFTFLAGLFSRRAAPAQPEEELPEAKVAVIGAGIGGCFAAKFLREKGGKKLDIHLFAKKDSKVGGRTAVFEFDGHVFETGASVIHSSNKYLSDVAKEHDLERKGESDPNVPIGIFDGKSMFRLGVYKLVNMVVTLWRYGLDLLRLNSSVGALLKKFRSIYDLQAEGRAFSNLQDMLTAMGGEEMTRLTEVSASQHMRGELGWNERLVEELVGAALRVNYGQGTTVNAFTAFVALAGMEDGKLWSVVGGNYKIAEAALKDAAYDSLIMEDVVSVTKTKEGADSTGAKYAIATADGKVQEGYDVVVVANPLNLSSLEYRNFAGEVYTAAAKTPYHRTVATFVRGSINQEFFGERADLRNFPQVVLTRDGDSYPFKFNSVAVEIPSEVGQEEVRKYTVPLQDEPVRVWKVFSPLPLTQDQCRQLFSEFDQDHVEVFDWMAYPQYHPPDHAPSFILDDGVFYVNAVEKAASAMEMSAIGAKNAALLARDYLLQMKDSKN